MNKFLSFILFFIITFSAKAQSWCPAGATWYTGVYAPIWGYDGVTEYRYTGDTLIQNKNCNVIKGTFYGQNFPDYSTLTHTYVPDFRTYYTYENNDVIFVLNGTSFDTVVNFKANIGDKWIMLRCPNASVSSYTVTDTSHVIINNHSLRTVKAAFLYPANQSSGQYTITHIFTERLLGGPLSWEDLFGRSCFHKINQGEAYGSPSNCGYRDDQLYLPPSYTGAACRLTAISENFKPGTRIEVFPNPARSILVINLNQPADIYIINNLGSKVYENHYENAGQYELNIENQSPGVYFLEVKTTKGRGYQKIIKE